MSNTNKPTTSPTQRPVEGWNKARTFATQSDAVKKAYADKMFEATVSSLRFSFLAGRVVSLHGIRDTLGLPKTSEADRLISKEELTELVKLAREFRAKPVTVADNKQDATVSKADSAVVPESKHKTDSEPRISTPVSGSTSECPSATKTDAEGAKQTESEEAVINFELPELEANPKVKPFGFQVRKTKELLNNFINKGHRANVLLSQTGSGKTFMLGAMVKAMFRLGFFKDYAGMWPVLYITKAPIVTQTDKVLEKQFGLTARQVHVTNIEQLRSTLGRIFIHEETVVIQGQEHIIFKWRPRALPRLVIWDEAQILMNIDSTQSKIAQALNDITELSHGQEANKVIQVFSSATPFMRLTHTKCFAVATRTTMKGIPL